MSEIINTYTILVGMPEGRHRWRDLGIDDRAVLKWISDK
jgi:hypothetical protein